MTTIALARRAAVRPAAALLLLSLSQGVTGAGPSALDADAHASDMPYTSDFGDEPLQLDATLPWKARFRADGSFNDSHRPDAATDSDMARDHAVAAPGAVGDAGEFDARGKILDVRRDAGKLKIEHGPIASLEMPGMTMLFNVGDPTLLDTVQAGEEIDFDVEYTQAGMVITRIRRAGDRP